MAHAKNSLGIERLYAIAKRGNRRSVQVLDRLGFRLEGPRLIPQGAEVDLYVTAGQIPRQAV
jgi:RimJ/RimL family protein N-acetyltransferase